MFEFVCEKLVPGCTHRDEAEKREELLERVAIHLREHHNLDHRDEPIAEALKSSGVVFLRPL